MIMVNYLKLIRISNWLKNLFVISPLVFSLKLTSPGPVVHSLIAFFVFSFTASGFYIYNDLIDLHKDLLHPRKKERPLASGIISKNIAVVIMILFFVAGIAGLFFLPIPFTYILASYVVLSILYNMFLKEVNLLETVVLAVFFVIRVLAGCFAITVVPSHWILSITFFLALFLVFIKRKSEIIMLGQAAEEHRKVLKNYSMVLLDRFIYITAAITLTSYMLYTINESVVQIFGSDILIYSTVFVVLGLFRFIQLSESGTYQYEGDPTTLLLKDRFLQVVVLCWAMYVVAVLYFHIIFQ